jgi:hypothetical protein
MYLKLFLLLFVDYTVIFAESPADLQAALNIFEENCSEWKLSNVSKTKIVVFSKRPYTNFTRETIRLKISILNT